MKNHEMIQNLCFISATKNIIKPFEEKSLSVLRGINEKHPNTIKLFAVKFFINFTHLS